MKARPSHWVGVLLVALVTQVLGVPVDVSDAAPAKYGLVAPVRKPLSWFV
jgi:hypothetical protein